jgi:hypothetical protein
MYVGDGDINIAAGLEIEYCINARYYVQTNVANSDLVNTYVTYTLALPTSSKPPKINR